MMIKLETDYYSILLKLNLVKLINFNIIPLFKGRFQMIDLSISDPHKISFDRQIGILTVMPRIHMNGYIVQV